MICVYGIYRRSDMRCIYVGSSCNYETRKDYHKNHYETKGEYYLYKIMKQNGGWDNHFFMILEERENHIGLVVIERFWYDCLLPIGNVKPPS